MAEMGFPVHWCERALAETGDDIEAALNWILSNGELLSVEDSLRESIQAQSQAVAEVAAAEMARAEAAAAVVAAEAEVAAATAEAAGALGGAGDESGGSGSGGKRTPDGEGDETQEEERGRQAEGDQSQGWGEGEQGKPVRPLVVCGFWRKWILGGCVEEGGGGREEKAIEGFFCLRGIVNFCHRLRDDVVAISYGDCSSLNVL